MKSIEIIKHPSLQQMISLVTEDFQYSKKALSAVLTELFANGELLSLSREGINQGGAYTLRMERPLQVNVGWRKVGRRLGKINAVAKFTVSPGIVEYALDATSWRDNQSLCKVTVDPDDLESGRFSLWTGKDQDSAVRTSYANISTLKFMFRTLSIFPVGRA